MRSTLSYPVQDVSTEQEWLWNIEVMVQLIHSGQDILLELA